MKQKISNLRSFAFWLIICLVLAGVPALIIYSTIFRNLVLQEEQLKENLQSELKQASSQSKSSIDQEEFWCSFFHLNYLKLIENNVEAQKVENWVENVRNTFNNEFEYISWDKNGNTVTRTFNSDYSESDWKKVFQTLSSNFSFNRALGLKRYKSDLETTRKILGKQYLPEIFDFNFDPRAYSFAWTDSTLQRPLYLSFFLKDSGFLLAFPKEKLQNHSGLKYFINGFAQVRNLQMGIFTTEKPDKDIWTNYKPQNPELLSDIIQTSVRDKAGFIETEKAYFFFQYLAPQLRLFIRSDRINTQNQIQLYALSGTAIFLLMMIPVFLYTYRTVVLKQPGNISIRYKLAFLFIFASGIPLLALGVISQENYSHKRSELINRAKAETTEMIISFDKRFVSHNGALAQELKKFFAELGPKIKEQGTSEAFCNETIEQMRSKHADNFYLVSSNTRILLANTGLFRFKGSIDNLELDLKNSRPKRRVSKILISDLNSANLFGKKVLSDLNNKPFPLGTVNKLEIIAETLMQKPFIEIVHDIVSNFDYLGYWGFGRNKDYGYSNLLSIYEKGNYDYIGFAFWRPYNLQRRFLEKNIVKASKNNKGIRFIAVSVETGNFWPGDTNFSPELSAFAKFLNDQPNEDLQIISLDNKKYIAVGFNGNEMNHFKIIGLHPLDDIERVIQLQRHDLLLFGLFCLLFSIGMAQILFRSFLTPIDALRNGALAIEQRNFDHRIKTADKDEFGQIADIFNDVMVGFKELEVARIVQESLFPKPDYANGNFRIHGRSITMSELGGDYFDFIDIDTENFALLIGDVAGHGVGAAVIMAMAKAGVLGSTELQAQPELLLTRLHQMILASKSKQQRKVMTFQYIYIHGTTNNAIYSNAGGCSPILIRENGRKAEELTLSGPALGAFKKAGYSSCNLGFKHGDAMIFYTDGIVETRNPQGEEIGYSGFKQILLDSYDMNPEVFYNNVLQHYQKHLGENEAQDDLTYLIMICDESKI